MNTAEVEEINPDELPEHIDHIVESSVIPTYHAWVQRGNWISCVSCQHTHGFDVGVHKRLAGMNDDGLPVLADC